ncbi:MAG TPA: CDP-glucose 4,6-dehydratase [Steroidobacteraceae bacterium]|nr:CDP-glucose 4,6-dehydratase [Steroidobacteraceae bacterium]
MCGALVNAGFWRGRRVLITGHTGFKGGWLALWLDSLGAQVHGFSLAPPTEPNFFTAAQVGEGLAGHTIGDIRDLGQLTHAMQTAAPEIVLHLAAQPLVRASYVDPVQTYGTNVLGTVHVLEAVRRCSSVRAIVNVTTDKVYENREWVWPYRESDPVGGHDPYASSKACAELVTSAYRRSFLSESGVAIATARAGNVIGGGDWAADRLLPDFFRAAQSRSPMQVRHPQAIRPWQHVLEPLRGYLLLAEQLLEQGQAAAEAWNFGPSEEDARSVHWLLSHLVTLMPGTSWEQLDAENAHEAATLKLDSAKARSRLKWRPRWSLTEALDKTVEWHLAWAGGAQMRGASLRQIAAHQEALEDRVP